MIKVNKLPESDYLLSIFNYNPDTGVVTRKVRRGKWQAGEVVNHVNHSGYLEVRVDGKLYKLHRLIWKMFYGKDPVGEIDHINRVKDDNKIKNLRDVDRLINSINKDLQSNNTSGMRGVSFSKQKDRWISFIKINGEHKHLGTFASFDDASKSRKEAEKKYWRYKE